MCSPMFDLPEHFPIEVDAQGRGPATGDDIDHIECWCGTKDCDKYLDDNERVIWPGVWE
ncbi:hypothetical protein [Mycobacteroides chelonae]|uniref:hypothetical protein n=1 Tax=Mycobacteroides chelonae TaxID=1774 RepID=UPI0013F4E34E|nr:hypothetical protein [Mycobacteroides chelonae]